MNNEIGTSKSVKQMFRFISSEKQNSLSSFCKSCVEREYMEFTDPELALICVDYSSDINASDLDIFINYSGYNFRNINNAARGRWNYEENGNISKKDEFDIMVDDLKQAINRNQHSIGNVRVFRGVTLDYFREYGIETLEDLEFMQGKFLLDKGFISTSLVDDKCFYKKDNDLGLNYNVKIEYMVPEEFTDGVCIGNISYSPDQCEYLINAWNMAQVTEVRQDGIDGMIVKATLIPKRVYDESYSYESGSVK